MKMSAFEYQMTKLDRRVLEADAENIRLAALYQRRLEAEIKTNFSPETASFPDDDLLWDNVPI